MDQCYRVGLYNSSSKRMRPIFLRFCKIKDRDQVWASRSLLKDSILVFKEDLPDEIESNARLLMPVMREAKNLKMKVSLNRDILNLHGQKFTVNNLNDLPSYLRPEILANKVTDTQHFFYGRQSKLYNFYRCQINDGYTTFNCLEQYYCFRKATHFRDFEARKTIMKLMDPVDMKRTKIANFDQATWADEEDQTMKDGLVYKFLQNQDLQEYILATEDKECIEANPKDQHWGIGCVTEHTQHMADMMELLLFSLYSYTVQVAHNQIHYRM